MRRTGLNDYDRQEEILKRVKEIEYKRRCWAVNICPWCGKDLHNIEAPSSHHVSMACTDTGCKGYRKIISDSRDN